jgi:hypothetical protein
MRLAQLSKHAVSSAPGKFQVKYDGCRHFLPEFCQARQAIRSDLHIETMFGEEHLTDFAQLDIPFGDQQRWLHGKTSLSRDVHVENRGEPLQEMTTLILRKRNLRFKQKS